MSLLDKIQASNAFFFSFNFFLSFFSFSLSLSLSKAEDMDQAMMNATTSLSSPLSNVALP